MGHDINAWVEAADLKPGMWLRTSAGTYVQVTATEHRTAHQQRVYNLSVADLHTYYVFAGNTPVLVHNDDPIPAVGTIFRDGRYSFHVYANDHGPAHGHLRGPGIPGNGIQIGQNGHPLGGQELTAEQRGIIERNKSTVRTALKKRMAMYRRNGC